MWAILKTLLAQWAIWKLLLRSVGSLAWLIPLGLILKAVGLPALMLLAVLALPLFLVLVVLGLPIILVVIMGGLLLSATMALVSLGVAALKIAVPVVLVWVVLRWLLSSRHEPPPPQAKPADAT